MRPSEIHHYPEIDGMGKKAMIAVYIEWNLSNLDSLETEANVLLSEVSRFEGL